MPGTKSTARPSPPSVNSMPRTDPVAAGIEQKATPHKEQKSIGVVALRDSTFALSLQVALSYLIDIRVRFDPQSAQHNQWRWDMKSSNT